MINSRKIKNIVGSVVLLCLSACADLSIYNQAPAPVGQPGQAVFPAYPKPVVDKSTAQEQIPATAFEQNKVTRQSAAGALNPAVHALMESSARQQQSGKLSIAASTLERAVRIAPQSALIWYQLALIRYQQANYDLALSLATKSNLLVLDDRPLAYKNWQLIAKCQAMLGNENAAKNAQNKANQLR